MEELYFDTAATTPLLAEVKQTMVESFDNYGNPSSLHRKGIEAENTVDAARRKVLQCLGVKDGRIVFTGSGTEANNLAIFGVAKRYRDRGRHIVTTQIEHACVLESHHALERDGWAVTYVKPESNGSVMAQTILDALREDTVLVSMMHVNNETGAILPIEEIGRALKQHPRTLFHVDGVQAFGKLPSCAANAAADLYCVSGHKIGAPKGIGALYVRKGLEIHPIIFGGGQQFGLRSGTENVIGIAALGRAAEAAASLHTSTWTHVTSLASDLRAGLRAIPGTRLNTPDVYSPYIVSCSFPGLRGEVLLHAFEAQGLYVSTGSACSSNDRHASGSHVLQAMDQPDEVIAGTVRFSLAPWHTNRDIERVLEIVSDQTAWIRGMI